MFSYIGCIAFAAWCQLVVDSENWSLVIVRLVRLPLPLMPSSTRRDSTTAPMRRRSCIVSTWLLARNDPLSPSLSRDWPTPVSDPWSNFTALICTFQVCPNGVLPKSVSFFFVCSMFMDMCFIFRLIRTRLAKYLRSFLSMWILAAWWDNSQSN